MRSGFLWRFVLLLICLAAAAVNTGNNLLYLVLSLMVALAAVAYATSWRCLRRLEVVPLLPDEVVAGRPFVLGIEARAAAGKLPAAWAEASLGDVPGEMPAVTIPALPPGGRAVASATARARERGIHHALAIDLATSFPFGLFGRRRRTPTTTTLVVTPRRRRIRRLTIESPADDGRVRSPRPGDGADLFNIRDYTTQDDARRIDWKASARLDRPMLKEFEREQERALEIVLDERPPVADAHGDFEDLVETAASILDYGDEKGIHARLVVAQEGGPARLLSGRGAMTYLAAVQPDAGAPPPEAGRPSGVPRIVLSSDPAVRTRIHVEWAAPEAAS